MIPWQDRLYRWGWVVLLFFAPLGGAVPGVLLFLAAALLALFAREKADPGGVPPKGLNALLGAVLLWGLVGGMVSPHRGTAVPLTVLYGLLVIAVFLAVRFAADRLRTSLEAGIWLLAAGSVVSSLYTLYTFFVLHYPRARSLWVGCNAVGPLFTLAAGVMLGYWQSHKDSMSRKLKRFMIIAIPLMTAALIATKSRGGLLGFVTMLVFIGLKSDKTLRWLAAGMLVMTMTVAVIVPSVGDRLASGFDVDKNQGRVFIWGAAVRMIEAHPWTGIGVGTFPLEYKNYKDPAEPRDSVAYAHNLFLAVGSEVGLPALAVFLVWLFLFGRHFYVKARGNQLLWGAFSAWLGVLVHQMVDNEIWVSAIAAPFWAIVALGLYWNAQTQRQLEEKGDIPSAEGAADYSAPPPLS